MAVNSQRVSRCACARKTAEDEKAARVQLPWKEPRSSTTDIGGGGSESHGSKSGPPGRGAVSASESARSIACAPELKPSTQRLPSPSAARARSSERSASSSELRANGRRKGRRAARSASSASTDAGGWCPKMQQPAFWLASRIVRVLPE